MGTKMKNFDEFQKILNFKGRSVWLERVEDALRKETGREISKEQREEDYRQRQRETEEEESATEAIHWDWSLLPTFQKRFLQIQDDDGCQSRFRTSS